MSTKSFAVHSSLAAIVVATAGIVLPAPAMAQSVADRTLSDVKVDRVGECTTLTIDFNIRVQLLSYFPQTPGRELHVRIRPLDSLGSTKARESLRTPATVPELRSIEYEGDNASGPVLSLFFTRDMRFTLEAGAQPQTLVIRIAEPGSTPMCEGAASPVMPAAPPPLPDSTAPVATAAPTTPSNVATKPAVTIPAGLYAINVISKPAAIGDLTPGQNAALAGTVQYETRFERDSQQWHRLRAGFYPTREAAEAAKAKLQAQFPDAWVVKITADERAQGVSSRTDRSDAVVTTARPVTPSSAIATDADKADTTRLIGEAEAAIRDSDNDRAVQLLTNALARPENADTPRALELLGVTRERKGQKAHAQAEYEEYLRRYPTGEGSDRVRQRLASLNAPTSSATGSPGLRAASGTINAGKAWAWGVRGSFSQFYFRDQGTTKIPDAVNQGVNAEVDNSVNLNQLLTTADLTVSGGNDRHQLQLRAAGSYSKNFGTSTTSINQNGTTFNSRPGEGLKSLSALYLDYAENDLNVNLRVGRQTRNSAGILGRFDGALVGFRANPKLKFNVAAGYPVETTRNIFVNNNQFFYGASVDIGARQSPLQTTLYWFDQHTRGGFIDRRSLGFETRYLKQQFNAYAMVDYDVKFKRLNLALLTMNYNFPDTSTISITADYRQSPLLTTNNAIRGGIAFTTADPNVTLPVTSLAGLRPFFTDEQIYQAAKDSTLVSKSLTVSYSRPLTKKLQTNLDFTLTNTGGTRGILPTAGTIAVAPIAMTGREYYYGAQLVGSGLLWSSDIYILSGRLSNTQTAKTYTADFNARVPITSKFRLSPRVRYAFQQSKMSPSNPVPGNYKQLQPTVRFNYYPVRHSEIEVEVGANFATRNTPGIGGVLSPTRETGFVISAGYRLDF